MSHTADHSSQRRHSQPVASAVVASLATLKELINFEIALSDMLVPH